MTAFREALAKALSQARSPGDFYASGTLDMHPLRLEVDAVGQIALPLLPVQAEQMIAVAEQAPYGRGGEILVDTGVRRTWQIDSARIHIGGRRREEDLSRIVQQAAAGLGVAGRVQAELYKLLIYDAGSFFVPHRDTEKATGMFATLVAVLPSPYSGGEPIIRHKDREARLEQRIAEPLVPPPDWRRRSEIRCSCPNCRNLSLFLDSPAESVWRLKAVQHIRDHLEHSIQRDHCDLDCATDKRGRPYTLICTKNQASYERLVLQRDKDLADRKRLLQT